MVDSRAILFGVIVAVLSVAVGAQDRSPAKSKVAAAQRIVWEHPGSDRLISIGDVSITWAKPPAFERDGDHAFVHHASGARIVMALVDTGVEELLASAKRRALAKRGVLLDRVVFLLSENGRDSTLLIRWEKDVTLALKSVVPDACGRELEQEILKAMLSLDWDEPFRFQGLGFSFEPAPGIRPWQTFDTWSIKCNALGRAPVSGFQTEFLIEEVRLRSALYLPPVEEFADDCTNWRISRLAREHEVEEVRTVDIDGKKGLEVVAKGRIGDTDVTCYQVILVTGIVARMKWDIYGQAPYCFKEEWLPRFRKMASSFREKPVGEK